MLKVNSFSAFLMDVSNNGTNGINGTSSKPKSGNWWQRRTPLEKKLFSFSIILFVISIFLSTILVLIYSEHKDIIESYFSDRKVFETNLVQLGLLSAKDGQKVGNTNEELSGVCLTPNCVDTAHLFLSSIDEGISPCDDFYRFSCGKWLNNSVIPDNRISISTTGAIVETMELQFKALAEQPSLPDDPTFFKNVRRMYASCMNLTQLAILDDSPLVDALAELGGWPLSDGYQWNHTYFDWLDTTLKMKEIGLPFNQFYHLSVGIDIKNSTKQLINIGEVLPGVGSRKVMLKGLKDQDVRTYFDLLLETASLLGGQQFNPYLMRELTQLINFQILIVNLTTPEELARNIKKNYNKMTVKDLELIAPNTNWIRLLSAIFATEIDLTDEVIVNNPNYVKQMDFILKNTDKRILANHMIADVVLSSLPHLSPKWLRLNDIYLHRITGRKAVPPRWQICIKSAASLTTAFSALYVRKYFDRKSKQKVEKIVNFIHKEFIQMLNRVDWMGEETRLTALEKAETITSYIGFPQQLLNDTEMAKLYKNLEELSDSHYFENVLKLNKWIIDYSAQDLRQLRYKGDWRNFADVAVINAYYSAVENAIIFPAGILQAPFFNFDNPDYVNFGAIGTVIAHEITHAFDDMGKQFDKFGNFRNWWDINTDQTFKSKAQCLIEQYNRYVLPETGIQLNGIITLGENIADNIGLREAFRAYMSYVRQNRKQQTLPGLKYSPEQLFWITFGNIWCTQVRPQVFKMVIDRETHSPAQFRVIGSVSNLPEFSQSFNCPKDSPMNPKTKCNIW